MCAPCRLVLAACVSAPTGVCRGSASQLQVYAARAYVTGRFARVPMLSEGAAHGHGDLSDVRYINRLRRRTLGRLNADSLRQRLPGRCQAPPASALTATVQVGYRAGRDRGNMPCAFRRESIDSRPLSSFVVLADLTAPAVRGTRANCGKGWWRHVRVCHRDLCGVPAANPMHPRSRRTDGAAPPAGSLAPASASPPARSGSVR